MEELYIGLMSGTSLNGVDAVLLEFSNETPRLLASHAEEFPRTLHDKLQEIIQTGQVSLPLLATVDHQLAVIYSEAVWKLLQAAGVQASQIKAIGSHGQTIYHQPSAENPNSLQLGDPSFIAEATGITVVADLRRRDMAAGGQGAPMVPAFHAAAFRDPGHFRVILNIGGIANLSLLPPDTDTPVSGFDTGPGNTLLDLWVREKRQLDFDENGAWAATGVANKALLEKMLQEAYFTMPPPKSTGRELFNMAWLEQFSELRQLDAGEVQATLLELSCRTIAQAIQQHAPAGADIFACGGGARNTRMQERLGELLPDCRLSTTSELGIEPEWVEAAAFAWLARQTLQNRPGNLTSVTGAEREVVLGGIFPGQG